MAWQPELEPLRQLSGYLKDALSAYEPNAQKQATLVSTSASTGFWQLWLTLAAICTDVESSQDVP